MIVMSNLENAALDFKRLLIERSAQDPDAARLLEWLSPLFSGIESGTIVRQTYDFRLALGRERDFFLRHKDIDAAETKFISALEGWETKGWYKNLRNSELNK
jgi:hypothetical protein